MLLRYRSRIDQALIDGGIRNRWLRAACTKKLAPLFEAAYRQGVYDEAIAIRRLVVNRNERRQVPEAFLPKEG